MSKVRSSPAKSRKVSSPAKSRKVSSPAKSRKVSSPAKSRKVSNPTKSRKVSSPANSRKISSPAKSRKISSPAKPRRGSPKSREIVKISLEKESPFRGQYHAGDSTVKRHRVLKEAVRSHGRVKIMRRVVVLAIYNKNKNPEIAEKFKADAKFVKSLNDPKMSLN